MRKSVFIILPCMLVLSGCGGSQSRALPDVAALQTGGTVTTLSGGIVQHDGVSPSTGSGAQYNYETIEEPHGQDTHITGINNLGKISGYYGGGSQRQPAVGFAAQSPYGKYVYLHYPGAEDTYAACLDEVRYVGGYVLTKQFNKEEIWMFVYGHGLYNLYRDHKGPPGEDELLGINDVGEGVGYYVDSNGNDQPFLFKWAYNQFTPLHPPNAISAEATGVNGKGDISGWLKTKYGEIESWVLIGGTYYTFQFPGAKSTKAMSINWPNMVVGQYVDATGVTHGFILTTPNVKLRRVWQSVDEPKAAGWTVVYGINLHHDIAGTYMDGGGHYRGFIGTISK